MPVRVTIEIDDEMSDGLNRLMADMRVEFPRELVISAAFRDWLIHAGYLPDDMIEEDTPTDGEA